MTDMFLFMASIGVPILSVTVAIFSANMVVCEENACGPAILLAVSSCFGFLFTLPLLMFRGMTWVPYVSGAVFGSIVLSTILCCLCQLKQKDADSAQRIPPAAGPGSDAARNG